MFNHKTTSTPANLVSPPEFIEGNTSEPRGTESKLRNKNRGKSGKKRKKSETSKHVVKIIEEEDGNLTKV